MLPLAPSAKTGLSHLKLVFSSATQSCPSLCNRMDCCTPGFPVHHQLPELAQTPVYQVSDVIQPSHPLSSPCPPALKLFLNSIKLKFSLQHLWGTRRCARFGARKIYQAVSHPQKVCSVGGETGMGHIGLQ